MEGHTKKCVERYHELANKTTQQLYKVSTPCIDDHHFKEEELKSVGELPKVCSPIVLKCWYLARIGRPDILWSVNKLARSIAKWTRACDKRLNRLISYIHHTCEHEEYCHVDYTAKQCRLGLFQDSDFAGEILKTQNLFQVGHCAFLEVKHLFQEVGCARSRHQFHIVQKNQTSSFGCRIKIGRYSRSRFCGIWSLQFLETRIRTEKKGETRCWTNFTFVLHLTRFRNASNLREWSMFWIMLTLFFQSDFASRSFVVCVRRQRSNDQDDHKGKKSHNETCSQNPQSCSWLVFRSNQFWTPKSKLNFWHQKPTRRHVNQGKFHTWRMEPSFVFV